MAWWLLGYLEDHLSTLWFQLGLIEWGNRILRLGIRDVRFMCEGPGFRVLGINRLSTFQVEDFRELGFRACESKVSGTYGFRVGGPGFGCRTHNFGTWAIVDGL